MQGKQDTQSTSTAVSIQIQDSLDKCNQVEDTEETSIDIKCRSSIAYKHYLPYSDTFKGPVKWSLKV